MNKTYCSTFLYFSTQPEAATTYILFFFRNEVSVSELVSNLPNIRAQ